MVSLSFVRFQLYLPVNVLSIITTNMQKINEIKCLATGAKNEWSLQWHGMISWGYNWVCNSEIKDQGCASIKIWSPLSQVFRIRSLWYRKNSFFWLVKNFGNCVYVKIKDIRDWIISVHFTLQPLMFKHSEYIFF